MSWRRLHLVLLLAVLSAARGMATPEYLAEQLRELRAAPFRGIASPERREEVALLWEELAEARDALPPVYRFLTRVMGRFSSRLHERARQGGLTADMEAGMVLLEYAALRLHEDLFSTGRVDPHPLDAELYRAALERLDSPTTAENYRPRILCLAVLEQTAWDPPLDFRTLRDFSPRGEARRSRPGLGGVPFTRALARSLDADLERSRPG